MNDMKTPPLGQAPVGATVGLGGRLHDAPRGALTWALTQPRGRWSHRLLGLGLRDVMRQSITEVTVDRAAFAHARAQLPPDTLLVFAPSHRSYLDFMLMGYLCFHQDELQLPMPFIAAAEEFGKLPLVGWLLHQCQAFYVRRGAGQAEAAALNATLQEIVEDDGAIMFFIEGQRSRARLFLQPKRGLLRGLQATGRRFAVLPIAFSYERLPEEPSLERELTGGRRSRLSVGAVRRWVAKVKAGEVNLGSVHITCDAPLMMDEQTDIRALSHDIISAQQRLTALTTFHLRAFSQQQRAHDALPLAWLIEATRARGATVLESDLDAPHTLSPCVHQCLQNQWRCWWMGDALARYPDDVIVQDHAQRHMFMPMPPAQLDDPRAIQVVDALLRPLRQDYALALDKLGAPGVPDSAPPYPTPIELVRAYPSAHLPFLEDAYKLLVDREILRCDKDHRHVWGARAHDLPALRDSLRAPDA